MWTESPSFCGVQYKQQHTPAFGFQLRVSFLVFMQYGAYSLSWKVLNNKKKKNGLSSVIPFSCSVSLEYFYLYQILK